VEMFILLDLERTLLSGAPCYWKGNKYGYTYDVEYAGVFTEELAKEIVKNDLDNKTVMIPIKLIRDLGIGYPK
jgi:hypothetical protein